MGGLALALVIGAAWETYARQIVIGLVAERALGPDAFAAWLALLLGVVGLRLGSVGLALAGGAALGSCAGSPGPLFAGVVLVAGALATAAGDVGRWRHAVSMTAAELAAGLALRGSPSMRR